MNEKVLARLRELRGWSPPAIAKLAIEIQGGLVAFPIHDEHGQLTGHVRYQPNPDLRTGAKSMGPAGVERQLFPPPEIVEGPIVFVVEGEPDAVAAWSIGLEAVGAPGASTWKDKWGPRFTGLMVVVVPDCDAPGRAWADKAAEQLQWFAELVVVLDLNQDRDDGFDLSDLVMQARTVKERADLRNRLLHLASVTPPPEFPVRRAEYKTARQVFGPPSDPMDGVDAAEWLERLTGDRSRKRKCPFHEERTGSLVAYRDGHFHCFGCGARGSVYEFAGLLWGLERRGDDFREIKRRVLDLFGYGERAA